MSDAVHILRGFNVPVSPHLARVRRAWPSSGTVDATTFTHDGSAVVAAGEDFPNMVDVATIRYFRVSDGAILVTYDQVGGANAFVKTVAISPDGASLGYTVANDGTSVLARSPF